MILQDKPMQCATCTGHCLACRSSGSCSWGLCANGQDQCIICLGNFEPDCTAARCPHSRRKPSLSCPTAWHALPGPCSQVLQLPCGHVFHVPGKDFLQRLQQRSAAYCRCSKEHCIADWFLDAKHDPCPFRCQHSAAVDGLAPRLQMAGSQVLYVVCR